MKKLICFIFPITALLGQINYTGSLKPGNMYSLSDQSEISLPFRLAEADVGYSLGDFEIKTNSALEYRWSNNENKFQLREAFLMWYPSWGEVKVGKQIHAWGAVDGNNPTDNLNPYDYYYMFLPGAERKVGTVSGSVKYYWNDWQFEGVFIPEHEGNRMPFGETAFPFDVPSAEPPLLDMEFDSEYGIRIQTTNELGDMSFSYFNGRDRAFDYVAIVAGMPLFSYRKTDVIGFDLVSFIGDVTNRFEVAYFITENDFDLDVMPFTEATYIQYAEQVEYTTSNDIMFSAQLIGSIEGDIEWDYSTNQRQTQTTVPIYNPGMGTPFAAFTDLGLSLGIQSTHLDNALDLKLNTFMDLKDPQFMFGVSTDYSPIDNWKINVSVSKFIGEDGTQFHSMEDFSHVKVGLEYHF
tara:strand:+ start:2529 stop:3752 length:1224 start_codon:yes stop_codon:yes gene_type:complete